MVQRDYDMGEITRSEILQRNERIKAISGLCINAGSALVIAGAARWFYTAFDIYTILWLVVGSVVVWSGLHVLTLLESESDL
jgi:hypothetical protein